MMMNENPKRCDCFAYTRTECKILTEQKCGTCKFYKTRKQYAEQRLASLDREAEVYEYPDFVKDKFKAKLLKILADEEIIAKY